MGSAIVVAVLVGVSIAVQVLLVGRASRGIHPLSISLALQGSGLFVGVIWALSKQTWSSVLSVTGHWWWLPLGALGWGIVAALGYSSARLGATATLAIVVATQLTAGLVLDRVLGEIDLGVRHPIGVLLLVGGALLLAGR